MTPGEERADPPPGPGARGPVDDESRAPLFGTWPRWYALVLAMLLAWIVFLAWITRSFR